MLLLGTLDGADALTFRAAARRFGITVLVVPLDGSWSPIRFGPVTQDPAVILFEKDQLAWLKADQTWPVEWVNAG